MTVGSGNKRMNRRSNIQVLPTVTNDFLFHFPSTLDLMVHGFSFPFLIVFGPRMPRKVSAFLGVNLLSRDGLARRVYGCPLKAISESTDLRIRTFLSNKISLVCAFLILLWRGSTVWSTNPQENKGLWAILRDSSMMWEWRETARKKKCSGMSRENPLENKEIWESREMS